MNRGLNNSLRILVLTPTGNDAVNATLVLEENGLQPAICKDLREACGKIQEGAGALLIAEEAFTPDQTDKLVRMLVEQAPWSDIPIIFITGGNDLTLARLATLNIFAPAGNVTLLERPLRPSTMVSSLQVALRARRRQYQMRDLLEQQQLVLASIHESFVTIDREWRFTYVSDRAAEVARLPREKMVGINCWDLFPDAHPAFYQGLHRAMNERVPVTIEHCYEPFNRWFETRAFPSPIGISVFTRDITERKEAERILKRSKEELEQRVEERTARLQETISELEAFSYSVSHDLRTPLRAMQGFSEFLLEEYSGRMDERGRDYIRRILQASARLDHLVQDILTYSRVARAQLEFKSIDLEKIVREVMESYPALHPSQVKIEMDLPLQKVCGHEGSLIQVVSNLLTNAVKFVAPGQFPHVRIRTEFRGEFVRVWFEDNGIGIAPEHQERIFKMFEKGPAHKDCEGTGIGLAIVRKAVERMEGRVGLESKAGHGSRFWIELPKAK